MPYIPIPSTGTTAEKIAAIAASISANPTYAIPEEFDELMLRGLQAWLDDELTPDELVEAYWTPGGGYGWRLPFPIPLR